MPIVSKANLLSCKLQTQMGTKDYTKKNKDRKIGTTSNSASFPAFHILHYCLDRAYGSTSSVSLAPRSSMKYTKWVTTFYWKGMGLRTNVNPIQHAKEILLYKAGTKAGPDYHPRCDKWRQSPTSVIGNIHPSFRGFFMASPVLFSPSSWSQAYRHSFFTKIFILNLCCVCLCAYAMCVQDPPEARRGIDQVPWGEVTGDWAAAWGCYS